MFCKAKSPKNLFLRGDCRPLPNKNVQFWDHFFPAFFPKDSESLKIWTSNFRKMEQNRPQNLVHEKGTNKWQQHPDIATTRSNRPRGPIRWKILNTKTLNISINPESSTNDKTWATDTVDPLRWQCWLQDYLQMH